MTISQRTRGVSTAPLPQPIPVPLGEWLPDHPKINNPGATVAVNCIPKENGLYGPWRQQVVESTNTMAETCNGSSVAITDDLGVFNYTGSVTKLYEYTPNTFTDASKAGGYTAANSTSWQFARYNDLIIGTNSADPVQSVKVGDGGSAKFADHITSTNKPKARAIATVGQFLVLGNTSDTTDGLRIRRVWWSAFGNPVDFDPSATTQSDFEDLRDGGDITALVGGAEYGVVFQPASITRFTYVGTPTIFRFDPVDRLRGCTYPRSIVSHGRLIFYWSDEGFMMFNGTTSLPIGAGKVDRTFSSILTPDNGDRMTATKDAARNLYIVGIPETQTHCTRVFIFNWVTGRWTEGDIAMDELLIGVSPGQLVDSEPFASGLIDEEPWASTNIDSDIFRGGQIRVGGVDSQQRMAWFTGLPRRAEIGSTESEIYPGQVAQIRAVTPYADNVKPKVQLTYRNNQSETANTTDEVVVGPQDKAQFRDKVPIARYFSAKQIFDENQEWENARSFDVYADPRGYRVE